MNLCEARKLAHEGWVRSPTRTNGKWVKVQYDFHPEGCLMTLIKGISGAVTGVRAMDDHDLNAEDWEPKPAPAKPVEPFEAEVWVHPEGSIREVMKYDNDWTVQGWRKIRVREVVE